MKNINRIITFFIFSILLIFGMTFFIYYNIYSGALVRETHENSLKVAQFLDNSLVLYFDKLRFAIENAVGSEEFQFTANKKEDALRFSPVTKIPADLKPLQKGVNNVWNWYKGLPGDAATARRRIARNIIHNFTDIHYVFEMDVNGDLVFLEPFDVQKHVTSYNYRYRDYLKLVKENKATSISEGYISHDVSRTQIITVATPIFNEQGEVAKVFAASISAKTIQNKVFNSLNSTLKLNDSVEVYIVDRHGHVVTSRSGKNIYFPGEGLDNDTHDRGNFRQLPIFDAINWTNDSFEKHNIWERKTKSWTLSSKEVRKVSYINSEGTEVYGLFYPMSIFDNSKLNWGILIEVPASVIKEKQQHLSVIFLVIMLLVCLILFFIKKVTDGRFQKLLDDLDIAKTSIHQLASRVSHDIKSPLTSLEYFYESSKSRIPEAQRIIGLQSLERIKDIINTLTTDPRKDNGHGCNNEMIIPLMERFASEKRNEYKNRSDVIIRLDSSRLDYDSFSRINRFNFMRALSNIINNSVEARREKTINISIALISLGDEILIQLTDNGKGIELSRQQKVFDQGYSMGKPGGRGIGLTQAREFIERDNGTLLLISHPGEGTTIDIRLKKSPPPAWFCHSIEINDGDSIVIVDDDNSIHLLLKERIGNRANVLDFYSPEEFNTWMRSTIGMPGQRYFFDQEFLGSRVAGLDLISEHGLAEHSILITSHYTDSRIQKLCEEKSILLIPKESVANIPVQLSEIQKGRNLVVIDDEPLFRRVIKEAGKDLGLTVHAFPSIKDFILSGPHQMVPRDSLFLIDSNLSGEVGEKDSYKIRLLGFTRIHICSGKDFKYQELPPHVKGFIPKNMGDIVDLIKSQ